MKMTGTAIVELAAKLACCDFNHGLLSFAHIMEVLKILAGTYSLKTFETLDKK